MKKYSGLVFVLLLLTVSPICAFGNSNISINDKVIATGPNDPPPSPPDNPNPPPPPPVVHKV